MLVLPYGEAGTYIDLEIEPIDARSDTNAEAAFRARASHTQTLARTLGACFPSADVVCGAGVVAVFGEQTNLVANALQTTSPSGVYTSEIPMRTHDIPVSYGGVDLEPLQKTLGIPRDAIVELHTGRDYFVEVVGFLPGFAYMGPVHPKLVAPRLASPRPRVDPQSVAIAGSFTSVYPLVSPGGWNLIGKSLGRPPFDPTAASPFLFRTGDRVRFHSADTLSEAAPARAHHQTPLETTQNISQGELLITRASGVATLQDQGRPGLLSQGMPPSGPLDPDLFLATNRALGNSPHATAVEILLGVFEFRARGNVFVSVDGDAPKHLQDGETLRIAGDQIHYVAMASGVFAKEVLGSTATLLVAKIGGYAGRSLQRGDVLRPRSHPETPPVPLSNAPPTFSNSPLKYDLFGAATALEKTSFAEPLMVDVGPHLGRFPETALETLLTSEFRVSALNDRSGTRLEGTPIPRNGPDLAAPVPMRRGAIQVTTAGTPIVLGPDHPTTGGYPVLAVIRSTSFGTLAARRIGSPVRFRLA